MRQTPRSVGVGQMVHSAELVDGCVGFETEVAKTEASLEVQIVDLAIPALGAPVEGRVRRQG